MTVIKKTEDFAISSKCGSFYTFLKDSAVPLSHLTRDRLFLPDRRPPAKDQWDACLPEALTMGMIQPVSLIPNFILIIHHQPKKDPLFPELASH